MAQDRTALIHRALRNLGVLPQGQSPSAEEYQSVSDLIDPMIESLKLRDVVDVSDVDNLEDEYFIALGHVLAWAAAPEFGSAADQALAALSIQAERQLTKMSAARYSGGTLEVDYF